MLGDAAHVTRLPDGGVLVADRGHQAVRFFSPNGRFQRAVGRQGSGPGEFEYIRVAYRGGESLFVEDIVTRRVMVYALNGTIARTLSTSEFAGGTDACQSACNADGLFVHHDWGRFDPAARGSDRKPVAVCSTAEIARWISACASSSRPTAPTNADSFALASQIEHSSGMRECVQSDQTRQVQGRTDAIHPEPSGKRSPQSASRRRIPAKTLASDAKV